MTPLMLWGSENAPILGEWYTTDNAGKVNIYECDGKLCGKITWLEEPDEEDGSEKTDINNPDKIPQPAYYRNGRFTWLHQIQG